MALVLDASVVVKVFKPEEHSDAALRLFEAPAELHAPAILPVEIANVLWRLARAGEISHGEARALRADYAGLPLNLHAIDDLAGDALDLALRFDRTVYDALYVALAERLAIRLVTADRRTYNALAEALPGTLLWVADVRPEHLA